MIPLLLKKKQRTFFLKPSFERLSIFYINRYKERAFKRRIFILILVALLDQTTMLFDKHCCIYQIKTRWYIQHTDLFSMPLSNKRSQAFFEEMTDSRATAENMEMSLEYLVTPERK